ncbi:MAG: hypothetical protein ACOX67_00670 [Oscillospiraceae bacterium]|jgi:hypothetical protein|nr:hypothetical protein [Pseudoflavonifractor sp.]MDY3019062.1 hypothetical protein [Oscillospiraceae bacterium]
MVEKGQGPGLLETLADLAGCLYLSDLHTFHFHRRLHWALVQCPAGNWPEGEWREAARYLLNQEPDEKSAEGLRQLLLEYTG